MDLPEDLQARREPVSLTVGATTIEDPYRWLEDDTPESLAWGEAQNALAVRYLEEWPHHAAVREMMSFWMSSCSSTKKAE